MVIETDPEISRLIDLERDRQNRTISLIASENIVSKSVLKAVGSELTNKYAEGYPGRRYYGGCEFHDEIETLAIERAKKIFGVDHANVQAHSGSNANLAAYFSLASVGDTVLAMSLDHGGHLTHGSQVNFSGKLFKIISYGVKRDGFIDYDELLKNLSKKDDFFFDLLYLGLGLDGHIASLFPGSVIRSDKLVASTLEPNIDFERITLMPKAIKAAKKICLLATGAQKIALIGKIRAGTKSYPADLVLKDPKIDCLVLTA